MPAKIINKNSKKSASNNQLLVLLKRNYLLLIFVLIILFVGMIAAYKVFLPNNTYIYVKVKVGQGYWWAATQRPSTWIIDGIKKGDAAYDLLGNHSVEVIDKRYYRYYTGDQYDFFLTLKMKVAYSKKSGQYSFSRSAVSVGSPVDIQFPEEEVTGTVIAVSKKPYNNKTVKKIVTLTKKYAYPWEFDQIKIGDSYFDGEEEIFKVLDKELGASSGLLSFNNSSGGGAGILEPANYVTIKAEMRLKNLNNSWIFGEDQIVVSGRNINISTPNMVFDNYIVSGIE